MPIVFIFFSIVAGVASGLQSGANNTLQKSLPAPWWSISIVSAFTLAAALGMIPFPGERLPIGQAIASMPWHGWLGGLFVLGFVLATIFASHRLGAGLFVALVVTASTITSLALDHWGLMGFDIHQAGWGTRRRRPLSGDRRCPDHLFLSDGF